MTLILLYANVKLEYFSVPFQLNFFSKEKAMKAVLGQKMNPIGKLNDIYPIVYEDNKIVVFTDSDGDIFVRNKHSTQKRIFSTQMRIFPKGHELVVTVSVPTTMVPAEVDGLPAFRVRG